MGLLSGGLSFRRYRVIGELPADFRDRFIESVGRHSLRENDRARTKDDIVGWVSITDSADTDLILNKFLYNNFLTLSMRVDRKRVPAKYLKIQVDRKIRETMAARGLERMGAAARREIKEAVEEELLGRALPVVGTYDMAWDIVKQEVWFFATSDPIHDLFRVLFKETFKLEVRRIQLSDWLQPVMTRDEVAMLAEVLSPESWRG